MPRGPPDPGDSPESRMAASEVYTKTGRALGVTDQDEVLWTPSRPHGTMVKTPQLHCGNIGSIPIGVIIYIYK